MSHLYSILYHNDWNWKCFRCPLLQNWINNIIKRDIWGLLNKVRRTGGLCPVLVWNDTSVSKWWQIVNFRVIPIYCKQEGWKSLCFCGKSECSCSSHAWESITVCTHSCICSIWNCSLIQNHYISMPLSIITATFWKKKKKNWHFQNSISRWIWIHKHLIQPPI